MSNDKTSFAIIRVLLNTPTSKGLGTKPVPSTKIYNASTARRRLLQIETSIAVIGANRASNTRPGFKGGWLARKMA